MSSAQLYKDYGFRSSEAAHTMAYLLGPILRLAGEIRPGTRVLDVGCGNGFVAGVFAARGCNVVGIDLSEQGIAIARTHYPRIRFEVLAAEDQVLQSLGEKPFDLVVSTEVVEHLYAPRLFARGCFAATRPGGCLICSTPYHGYLKYVALSLSNRMDAHLGPLWDGGHIKFWSRRSLSNLLSEAGFRDIRFRGAGRVPFFWKSMILAAIRPA